MQNLNRKTNTDLHWDSRAIDPKVVSEKVNIGDTAQRDLEIEFILSVLPKGGRTLEVGCGNGYLTKILRANTEFVDAFDYSENMIAYAKRAVGEKNNRFFIDNILDLKEMKVSYDTVVCVRVLINLASLEEQVKAIENLAAQLKSGGKLILIEGYKEGFDELNILRQKSSLPPLVPAPINFYSNLAEIKPQLEKYFVNAKTFHTGTFDFLTRVVYPLLAGSEQVSEAGGFHKNILPLAQNFNLDSLSQLGRLKGFELIKR
jgi:SAM-dependent methyltransferase